MAQAVFVPGNADGGEGMEGFMHSAYMMKQAAETGQFAADPESGTELVRVCRNPMKHYQAIDTGEADNFGGIDA